MRDRPVQYCVALLRYFIGAVYRASKAPWIRRKSHRVEEWDTRSLNDIAVAIITYSRRRSCSAKLSIADSLLAHAAVEWYSTSGSLHAGAAESLRMGRWSGHVVSMGGFIDDAYAGHSGGNIRCMSRTPIGSACRDACAGRISMV